MSYLVLARKWRPQQFADILGQAHVTRTLTNALSSGRVAHAFLFTGARGVGKTSAARILAKALNCQAQETPTTSPCGVCSSCSEIAEGRSTDVFEIDAASNTGVANVREIIDNVRYLPGHSRFKIYIIDEVHMLSTGAFNALLKTLEEPPDHAKFILATTDVHKVPVTILSRCQRYDFRRIPLAVVADRLAEILGSEGLLVDRSGLEVVARESEGSMRDAQSLLERVLTYAADRALNAELVREALGVADRGALETVVDALLERDPARVIETIAEIHERGLELKRFGDALVEYVRDLLMARLLPDPRRVVDRPRDELEALVARAQTQDPVALERVFMELTRVVEEVGASAYPRFALEVGLASLAEAPPRVPLDQLVRRLEALDTSLSGAAPRAASPSAAPASGRDRREAAPPPRPFREAVASVTSPPREAPPPEPQVPPPPAPSAAPSDAPAGTSKLGFESFVQVVRKRRPTLYGQLAHVRPVAFGPGRVELGVETRFDEATLGAPDTKRYLEEMLKEHLGSATELVVTRLERALVEPERRSAPPPPTMVEREENARRVRRKEKEEQARKKKAVKTALEELGAKVAAVRVIEDEEPPSRPASASEENA